jgi:hypothetical protein
VPPVAVGYMKKDIAPPIIYTALLAVKLGFQTAPCEYSVIGLLPGNSSCGRQSHKAPAERDRAAALHDDIRRELYVTRLRSPGFDAPKAFWPAPTFRHG